MDYILPRQLIELLVEFISGMWVNFNWGEVVSEAFPRGDFGVPQGFFEGMLNFSVYSDNIQSTIIKAVPGILVGGQVDRYIVYSDDDSTVNQCLSHTNRALQAIASQGVYNCY